MRYENSDLRRALKKYKEMEDKNNGFFVEAVSKLWSEVDKWMGKSPLLSEILKWTKTYIYMKTLEKRWFAVTRTATKPENMQDFHEDNAVYSR